MLAIIIIVVLFIVAVALIYFVMRKKKSKTKQTITKDIEQAASSNPILNNNVHAMKPIICPECILEFSADKSNPEKDDEMEEDAPISVMVFSNWMTYAAHILQKHKNSPRVEWAISCVKTEVENYNKEGKELTKSLQTLIELIQSHGEKPDNLEVGEEYNTRSVYENKTDDNKPIQTIDDWAERLGKINNLGKED